MMSGLDIMAYFYVSRVKMLFAFRRVKITIVFLMILKGEHNTHWQFYASCKVLCCNVRKNNNVLSYNACVFTESFYA